MTGNAKLPAVNALTVIREQEAELCALTAERDELLARVEQLESILHLIYSEVCPEWS